MGCKLGIPFVIKVHTCPTSVPSQGDHERRRALGLRSENSKEAPMHNVLMSKPQLRAQNLGIICNSDLRSGAAAAACVTKPALGASRLSELGGSVVGVPGVGFRTLGFGVSGKSRKPSWLSRDVCRASGKEVRALHPTDFLGLGHGAQGFSEFASKVPGRGFFKV